MSIAIINDLHVGVQRTGGTTHSSAFALRAWASQWYADLLSDIHDRGVSTVIVNGDLTDAFDISLAYALDLFSHTLAWLNLNPANVMVWALGNHDLSKDSSKLGTVQFIGSLLSMQFPAQFQIVAKPETFMGKVYIIPHMVNQDAFEEALDAVPEGVEYLLLHCNYDNPFSGQQDHSLNLSRDTAKKLRKRGIHMILGHEHQARRMMSGWVHIAGNQFPTSVSDCIGKGDAQADGCKYYTLITDAGIEAVPAWDPADEIGWYREIDWQQLDKAPEGQGFIRVAGNATAEQAAEVVRAISALRQKSQAFVITNAVKIDSIEGMDDLAETAEDIRNVDVIAMLMEMLEPAQQELVKKLMSSKEGT